MAATRNLPLGAVDLVIVRLKPNLMAVPREPSDLRNIGTP
jgi:hypothetical protein